MSKDNDAAFPSIVIFVFMGGIQKFASKPLERCYHGLQIHPSTQPGDVSFVYHTYRGCVVWCVQNEHRVIAPSPDAKLLLRRLLRFNLTWGLLSYGLLFVPFRAIGNYAAQKRSIARQENSAWPLTPERGMSPGGVRGTPVGGHTAVRIDAIDSTESGLTVRCSGDVAMGSESIDSMCPVSDAIAVWIREHPDLAVREILVDFTNVNYQWGDAPVACLLPFIRQGVEHFRFRASANSALALESLLGPMQLPWFSVERVPVHGAAAHDERPENSRKSGRESPVPCR